MAIVPPSCMEFAISASGTCSIHPVKLEKYRLPKDVYGKGLNRLNLLQIVALTICYRLWTISCRCPGGHGCIERSIRPGTGTIVRTIGRSALCIAAAMALNSFLSQQATADVLYSVTNLGPAAPATGGLYPPNPASYPYLSSQTLLYPNGNYLGALSQSEQAAFQSGSFDIYAHPATVGYLPTYYSSAGAGTDILIPYTGNGFYIYNGFDFTTSNNLGVSAGTANRASSAVGQGDAFTWGVTFTPGPHTVSNNNPYDLQTETSPGYLGTFASSSAYGQFYGTVAGINDHGNLALNEFTWPNTFFQRGGVVTPHLSMGNADISLGSLGGTNGVAYALNNSNQVVGWSQIASGAQHAFLYSNGTMQDLNLLIPPLSGVTLTSAVGIDSAGEIVAFGTGASGQTNEYLLTPLETSVPEPCTLAVFTVMIAAFVISKAARCSSAKR